MSVSDQWCFTRDGENPNRFLENRTRNSYLVIAIESCIFFIPRCFNSGQFTVCLLKFQIKMYKDYKDTSPEVYSKSEKQNILYRPSVLVDCCTGRFLEDIML